MSRVGASSILLLGLVAVAFAPSAARAQASKAPVSVTPRVVVGHDDPTTALRQAFERGLTAAPVGHFAVALTWRAYPGADSYRVLRSGWHDYSPGRRQPVVVASGGAIHYNGPALPGYDFFFRIVAMRGAEPLDTTTVADVNTGADGFTIVPAWNPTCTLGPSHVHLSWQPIVDVSHINVSLILGIQRFDTTITSSSYDFDRAAPLVNNQGLVYVSPIYSIFDFPAAGETTAITGTSWVVDFYDGASTTTAHFCRTRYTAGTRTTYAYP
ncbi:MAG TPA: hypothetical protein VGI92_08395 [Gemmatimonadales bacterium]|jgi:hypothetical protein